MHTMRYAEAVGDRIAALEREIEQLRHKSDNH